MATSFEPFSFSPSTTTFNPLGSLQGLDFSKLNLSGLQNIGTNLAQWQKINDPKTYESFRTLKLQDAPKLAESLGWGFASQYSTPESTASNEQRVKSLYDDLIAYGYSPEVAKANTYDVAAASYQQSAAEQAYVENFNPTKAALTASLPLLLSIALPGLGSAIGTSLGATGAAANILGGGLVGGGLSAASGGDFLQGALGGALGAGASSLVTPAISGALGGGQFGNIAAGALTGGGVAELMGGDFTTGALRGGVSAGLSDYQQQLRQEAFDTAMTESGLAGQTSVEGFQPPVVEVAAPTIQDVISQITVPTQEQAQPSIDQLITQLAPFEFVPENIDLSQLEGFEPDFVSPSADSSFVGPRQEVTVPTFEQQTSSIDQLIAELAPYEAIPEITITAPREQTVPTQEEMQPVIDDLIVELAPYEVPPTQEIVITAPREQTVPTQEETQLSIDDLLTELAPYEVPEIPEIVITAPREQTVLTQEQMQPEIDELLTELAPYEVIPEAIDTSAGLQTVPTQEEAQLSVNELLTELAPYEVPPNQVLAEPDVQPEPVDNSRLISALDVLKVISPAVITALLADNASQTTTETPEQTGFPILPIPGDWRSPTYNQAFTPSAPIDFGTSALLAGTQWENLPQFQEEQPYSLSNLINTLNYQSVPFVQQQYQMPEQTLNVNDVVSQYRTTPTVGTRDIIGNLGGKPVSIADIISGIQSQYG